MNTAPATASFTPGPWRLEDRLIIANDGTPVSGCVVSRMTTSDARLIAAAPELLEACRTFAEWLRREDEGFCKAGNERDTTEGEQRWREWYYENIRLCGLAQDQARSAIAKATGA